jgi:hypothetical protein
MPTLHGQVEGCEGREDQVNQIDKKLEQLHGSLTSLEQTVARLKEGGGRGDLSEDAPKAVPTFLSIWSGLPATIQQAIERINTVNGDIRSLIF